MQGPNPPLGYTNVIMRILFYVGLSNINTALNPMYNHGSISRVDAKTIDELVLLCWIAKSMMASFTESILPNVNNNSATEANMKCQTTVYVKLFSGI